VLVAVCTCTPLVVALAAALVACAGGGYTLGTLSGKTFAFLSGHDPGAAADLGGTVVGVVGFMVWVGFALVLVAEWLA
jgi:hypothetical protein